MTVKSLDSTRNSESNFIKKNPLDLSKLTKQTSLLFDIALDLICIANLEGYFIIVNKAWEDVLGYELTELNNHRFLDFVHPDDYDATNQIVQDLMNQKKVSDFVNRYRDKKGEYHFIEWRPVLVKDRIFAAARDITVKKNQEQKLLKSYERFHQLSRHTQTFAWEVNSAGLFTFVNDVCEDVTGFHPCEVINLVTFENWHPQQDKEQFTQQFQTVIAEHKAFKDLVHSMIRKDGRHIWVSSSGVPIYHQDGSFRGYLGLSSDITFRKALEDEIKGSRQLLQYIIEHNPGAIAIHDCNLKYIYVSQSYLDQYRLKDRNIIGKHHYDVFPDLPQKWRDVHQKALKGEVSRGVMDPYPHADGTIDYTTWQCYPWYKNDGTIGGIIVYTQVINEQVEMMNKLTESQQMLNRVMDNLPIGIAVNRVFPKVEFVYMNENFPIIYGTSKDQLANADSFWEAVYEDPFYREEMKHRVQNDIDSGDPKRMRWENIALPRIGKPTRYITAYTTIVPTSDLVISTVVDVTEQNVHRKEIDYIHHHDALTGLFSRIHLREQMDFLHREDLFPVGIMILDFNGLKLVNDAFGVEEGDRALILVANVLKSTYRNIDVVARMGGGQFAAIIPKASIELCENLKHEIQDALASLPGDQVAISLAIGYSMQTNPNDTLLNVLKKAEDVMYARKLVERSSIRNRTIRGILQTLTNKYKEEKVHSERVSYLCQLMGKALHLNEDNIKELTLAGLVHDIGKISLPDAVLYKPTKLTEVEYDIVKKHTEVGYQILKEADEYSGLASFAKSHHERWDGKGYPEGLKGNQIPFFARIICIADAYEAMTANRPYRQALSPHYACNELLKYAGTQFDPELVNVFIDVMKE